MQIAICSGESARAGLRWRALLRGGAHGALRRGSELQVLSDRVGMVWTSTLYLCAGCASMRVRMLTATRATAATRAADRATMRRAIPNPKMARRRSCSFDSVIAWKSMEGGQMPLSTTSGHEGYTNSQL